MDHNGLVLSPHLHFDHFVNHNHSLEVRAPSIRSPVGDLELVHLSVMSVTYNTSLHKGQALAIQCEHTVANLN